MSYKLVLLMSVQFCMLGVAEAKDWRGIIPLRSTRADVESLLGKPNALYGRYQIENEEANISYSGERCTNGWNVPAETVIGITVSLIRSKKLSEFSLDLTKFKKESDGHLTAHTSYTNKEQGLTLVVLEDQRVLSIYYEPTADNASLWCGAQTTQRAESTGNPHCPLIAVSCSRPENHEYSCSVNQSGGQTFTKQSYVWRVSVGEIMRGQGTSSIKLRAPCLGLPPSVTVQVEKGIPEDCPTKVSSLLDCN